MTIQKMPIIERPFAPAMPQCANWLVNMLMNEPELLELASSWAYLELEDLQFSPELIHELRERHEDMEDTPVYNAYYRAQTAWFRKLLTASAALL